MRERLQGFNPTRMTNLVLKVRQNHPNLTNGAASAPSDLLAVVRNQLELADTQGKLMELARNLKPQELLAALTLFSRSEPETILNRAERVLHSRRRPDLLVRAWRLLIENHLHDKLETLVRDWGEFFDWTPLSKVGAVPDRLRRWFTAKRLTLGILEDFFFDPREDLQPWLESVGLPRKCRLNTNVWVEIFRSGTSEIFDRLGHEWLLKQARRETRMVQEFFAQRYLTVFRQRKQWNELLCSWILEQFNAPAGEGVQPLFWRPIETPVRQEFLSWVNERRIREFFWRDDDQNRAAFWLHFSNHFQGDVKIGEASVTPVLYIDFGSFGIVEFAHIGNAAYVYPREVFLRKRALQARSVHPLKDKEQALGRIIHSGRWEDKYRPVIGQLLRH